MSEIRSKEYIILSLKTKRKDHGC